MINKAAVNSEKCGKWKKWSDKSDWLQKFNEIEWIGRQNNSEPKKKTHTFRVQKICLSRILKLKNHNETRNNQKLWTN